MNLFFICFILCFNLYGQHDTTNANRLQPLNKNIKSYFCKKDFKGRLIEEGFKAGNYYDGEIRFYEEGKLVNIFTYIKGEPTGFYGAYYYPNGNISILGNLKEGKKEGVFKEYDISGKLTATKVYHNDVQVK